MYACILIRSEHGKFRETVERVKQFKEVRDAFPVLGRYDVVIDAEAPDAKALGNLVVRIGKLGGVVFTETLPEIQT